MLRMIAWSVYKCPHCGYEQNNIFPFRHYEAGSAGTRTYECPKCGIELDE